MFRALRSAGVPPLSIRGACPHLAIRGVRSTPFRSALIPNIHYSRSLLIDRCADVPSSKTVHWTVFEFTPGTRDFVRSVSRSAERRSAAAVNSRCVPALGNSRCVPALGNSRGSLHFVPLCTRTEHLLLAVFTLLTGAAAFCSPWL